MRIESDVKLDFKDVLLRPKRSTLGSRSNVDLDRLYSFRHARLEMPVVPVIAAGPLLTPDTPRPTSPVSCGSPDSGADRAGDG